MDSRAGLTDALKSVPGETFAPAAADPGMNLHEEFAMALALYHSEKER